MSEVYKIINKAGETEGVYSRSYHDVYEFSSIEEARSSNCHDVYKDKAKYKIAKYKVTYELIDDDCDPASEEEKAIYKEDQEFDAEIVRQMDSLGLNGFDRMAYAIDARVIRGIIKPPTSK